MGENGAEIFKEGSKVEVTSNDEGFIDAWYVATVIAAPSPLSSPAKKRKGSKNPPRTSTSNTYFVEYDTLLDDDNVTKPLTELVDVSFVRPLPPTNSYDGGFEAYDVVDVYHRDGWWKGYITEVLEGGSRFAVSFQNPPEDIECPLSDVRFHLEWVGGGEWVRPEKQNVSVHVSRNREKTVSSQSNASNAGDTMDIQHASSDATVDNAENEKQTVGGLDFCAGKFKRKKRSHAKRSQASAEGIEGNKNRFTTEDFVQKDGVGDVMSAKEPRDSRAGNSHQLLQKAAPESVPDENSPARELQNTVQEIVWEAVQTVGEANHKRKKRGRPRKLVREIQNGTVEGSEEAPEGNASEVDTMDSGAKDATVDDGMLSDDQPLTKWLEGMHSSTVMNKGASNGMTHELRDEVTVEQNRTATPTISSPVVNSDSVEKSPGLPFVKCSPMWNSVESLEVFQKTPQRPHFSPLVKCSEDSREGLAIGQMVIFANLVERTSKLQLSDPQCIIDRSLATLAELENHGFSVEVVRRCLNELQDLKFRLARVEEEEKEEVAEIERLNVEKTGFDGLINLVGERMKQIQQKLAVAASMRDAKVEKIGGRKAKLDRILQLKEDLKHEFERITDSML